MYDLPLASLRRYVERYSLFVVERLGNGVDGVVYGTKSGTAIKGFRFRESYVRERNAYQRLLERGVTHVDPFDIPVLINVDDELAVLEMTIVSPPFILDFSGAYIDRRPPFDDEALLEWYSEKEEMFGARWEIVDSALSKLKRHGVYLSDIHPRNVMFGDDFGA